MSKESREIEKLNPNEEVGKKRKIVFWSMIATGVGVIIVVVLLLIFLIPKEEKYEISLGSSGTSIEVELTGEGSYKKGDSVTIVAEDIDGYRFTGWSYGGNIISIDKEYSFVISEENEGEYTANYAKIYTVSTFDNDNYGSFTVAPTEAIAGETVTVRYEVNSENQDKYQLKRLYYVIAGDLQGTQTTIENNTFTMPEGNVTIYAEFNNLYNINLTTNIDEEVDLTGEGTYIENETVTISAPNIAGYRFRNWTYNGDIVTTQQEYTIANIDSTTSGTYIANYDRLYSITVNSSHGTVAIVDNKTNAIENENIEFTVEPNSDYRLIEVKVNNETLQAQDGKYSFAMPAENVTIDVTYSQLFDISVTSEHGTVSITDNKTEAIANENVSFTVQAESGYRIANVSINNGDVTYTNEDNTYSFSMPAENVTIDVTYIQQFEVILQSDMENADLSGADTYDIGSEVTITASTNIEDQDGNQYRFIGWQHNEEFIPAEEGGIYEFILSADTAGIYTAIYESAYKVEVEENSAQYIQIESTQAFEDDNITFTASIEDTVSDTEIIIKSIKIMANGEEIEYTNDGNQYSFIMPASDVVISVVEETRSNIIKDFVISGNRIKQYTGTDSEVVVPSTYRAYQQESDGILEFESFNALNSYMQQELGQFQIGGGYFTYKLNDSEYSEEIKDVQAWLSEMQTHSGDSEFNLTIKLPTEYTVTEEDAVELGDDLRFSVLSPFYQLYMSSDYIISFTYQIGDGEIVSVDANNIGEIVEKTIGNKLPEAMLPIKFTNIKYGKVIACEGDANVITSIGDEAFANCSNLTNISIPNSITYIGDSAFSYRSNITEIHYQGTMDQWLNMTFGSSWLPSNDNINLYFNDELVDEITVNADIPSNAFYSIDSITKVTIGEGVTSIGDDAFSFCSNLTEITLPSSVTSIGNSAFYNCSNLTEITLPSSLTSIGNTAFHSCYALALVKNNSNTLTITKGKTDNGYVGYYAKEVVNNGATAKGRIKIIDNVQYYINDTTGEFIALAPAISRNAIISISIAERTTEINQYAFNNCSNLTEITLPSSLTSIGNYAFYNCRSLETVTFAEGSQLESISDSAFSNCSALQSIELPSSVTSIGDDAFSYCSELTEITLPASLKSIGDSAFSQCTSLAKVTFAEGSNLKSISGHAFAWCESLQNVIIPQDSLLETIDEWAFYECQNLTSFTIPSGVTEIGDDAFNGCRSLVIIYNYSTLNIIANSRENGYVGYYALEIINASDLSVGKIEIIENIQYYVNETTGEFIALAPIEKNEITSVDLDPRTTAIYPYAFHNCDNLTNVNIPSNVISIGESAFSLCDNLQTVTFDENSKLQTIGLQAFQSSSISSITIPSSVKNIGQNAFGSCTNLTTVILSENLNIQEIGAYAFSSCYNLVIIINYSKLEIEKGSTNNGYLGYYAYEIVTSQDQVQGRIEVIGDVKYYINNTSGEVVALNCLSQDVTNIELDPRTTIINYRAFWRCGQLNSITIPESVTKILDEAFYGCRSLVSITIPSSVESIDDNAFSGCSNLATVTIESDDIYKDATSATSAGYLLQNATTVKVPTSIVEANDNSYLEDTANFTTSVDGEYTVFTKVS